MDKRQIDTNKTRTDEASITIPVGMVVNPGVLPKNPPSPKNKKWPDGIYLDSVTSRVQPDTQNARRSPQRNRKGLLMPEG